MNLRKLVLRISLGLLICTSFSILIFADIPVLRAKSVSVQAKQDFPDYDFYLCTVPVTSYYNQGRHYTSQYEKLILKSIEVSTNQPYVISNTDSDDEFYIIAVRKSSNSGDIAELKKRVIEKLTKKAENGVNLFSVETRGPKQSSDAGDQHTVFTIESISDKPTESNQEIVASEIEIVRKNESPQTSSIATVAAGLFLSAALILIGVILFNKSKKS